MVYSRDLEMRVGRGMQEEGVPYVGRKQMLFKYFWRILKYGD